MNMDLDIVLWLQGIRDALGNAGNVVMNSITLLASASIAIAALIYWCSDKKKGRFAFAAFCFSNIISQTVKNICCVYRPWIRDSRIHPYAAAKSKATGYSFPSGHSESAASAYGAIAYGYRKNRILKWLLIVLILLVGISRVYLGVHTPQDAIVGIMVGVLSIYLLHLFVKWYEKKERNDLLTVIGGLILVAALIVFTVLKVYPMDYVNGKLLVNPVEMQSDAIETYGLMAGYLISWFLEKKYVSFSTDSLSRKDRMMRIVIGLAVTGVMFAFAKFLLGMFLEDRIVKFMEGLLAGTAVIFAAPLLFTLYEKKHIKNSHLA
jgi:membrane-associated phospholipid phosphatase